MRSLLTIICISLVIWKCEALYFFLKNGQEKCFLQELPNDTLLVAKYRCSAMKKEMSLSARECRLMINIKDPLNHIVLSRMYRLEGRFSYKSQDPGMHLVCMHPNFTNPQSKDKLRIDFDLQVGGYALNASLHKRRLHVTNLESRYRHLLEKAVDIEKEIEYLRYREEIFRETTESLSRRIFLWLVVEIVLLVVVGVWQVENLRQYFDTKKVV